MTDHTYSMDTLHVAGGDGDVEEEMDEMLHPAKRDRINKDHTPIKQQQLKKMKPSKEPEDTYSKILQTMQVLSLKIDEQTELLKSYERRIEANSVACKVNREDIGALQEKITVLQRENSQLKEASAEHARYKRRWNLRLIGLPEKDGEDTREITLGILTRIVPVSIERLRESVDTVHRLGRRGDAASANYIPRAINIQFGMRIVRDDVWK
ncbi:hypothetical protein DPEC_G00094510 [Dallia pectoralis]|uniref:Uncharacterized protein n=1 Tax=Dallia pectoralis TaxID=75939 RepID=A0ACC2H185_DALPE|nr:hypothetical protein DPEC_G00094510 [Dallia pectoralis]